MLHLNQRSGFQSLANVMLLIVWLFAVVVWEKTSQGQTPVKNDDGRRALNARQKSEAVAFEPSRKVEYKKIKNGKPLKLHIFEPPRSVGNNRPVAVFFFGGGWVKGTADQFYPQCAHLAQRGVVAISAEYRIKNKHKTTPFECVKDAKSAIRWIRAHAVDLRIDPQQLIAGGGSAGGHIAAATATLDHINEADEDTSINCVPNALVLFNPVIDQGPGGYGHKIFGEGYKEISPIDNIAGSMPPTVVFLGTRDKLVSAATGKRFKKTIQDAGGQCELWLYEGEKHGFFNFGDGDTPAYHSTVKRMDSFLQGLGFLK